MDIWQSKYARITQFLSRFPQPKDYSCRVQSYSLSHGRMIIRMRFPNDSSFQPTFIFLESVWYFSGPMLWKGIDFQVQMPEASFIREQMGWQYMSPEIATYFAQMHFLFVLDRPTYRVQFLAGNCVEITQQEVEASDF